MKMIALGLFAFPFVCVLLGAAHEIIWTWVESRVSRPETVLEMTRRMLAR